MLECVCELHVAHVEILPNFEGAGILMEIFCFSYVSTEATHGCVTRLSVCNSLYNTKYV